MALCMVGCQRKFATLVADPRGAIPIYLSGNGPYFLDDIDSLDSKAPVTSMMMEPGRRKLSSPSVQRKDSTAQPLVDEKSLEITPKVEVPSSANQEIEAPSSEKESTENPVSEKESTENPVSEKESTENPAAEKESTENPVSEKESTENPASEKESTENPVSEKESTENPVSEKESTENPVSEKESTENPVSEKDESIKSDIVSVEKKDTQNTEITPKNEEIKTSNETTIKSDAPNQSSPLTVNEEKKEVTQKAETTETTVLNPSNLKSNEATENLLLLPEILDAPIFEIHEESLEKKNIVVYNDIEYPKNTVFSIQIGAFRNPISQEFYDNFSPVITENLNDDLKRYTVGLFNTLYLAKNALRKIKSMGYSDAFIIVHDNGKRMTLQQWRNL